MYPHKRRYTCKKVQVVYNILLSKNACRNRCMIYSTGSVQQPYNLTQYVALPHRLFKYTTVYPNEIKLSTCRSFYQQINAQYLYLQKLNFIPSDEQFYNGHVIGVCFVSLYSPRLGSHKEQLKQHINKMINTIRPFYSY